MVDILQLSHLRSLGMWRRPVSAAPAAQMLATQGPQITPLICGKGEGAELLAAPESSQIRIGRYVRAD